MASDVTKKMTSRDLAQQRTRETLLATAAQLVAEKGLGAVSIGDIAVAAGFTKGAFYSNFESREAMLFDLMGIVHAQQSAAMNALEAEAPPADLSRALDQLVEICVRHADSPTAALLIGEMQLQARRSPEFARLVEAGFQERLAGFSGWIDKLLRTSGARPALSSTELARIVLALSQGMAQQPADRKTMKGLLRQAFGRLFAET